MRLEMKLGDGMVVLIKASVDKRYHSFTDKLRETWQGMNMLSTLLLLHKLEVIDINEALSKLVEEESIG